MLVIHIALVKNGVALRSGYQKQSEDALDYRNLHKSEWNYRVNSPAVKWINANKRTKTSAIPMTEDLQKLRLHVSSRN